jgi:hypothetical protein
MPNIMTVGPERAGGVRQLFFRLVRRQSGGVLPGGRTAGRVVIPPPSPAPELVSQPTAARDGRDGRQWQSGRSSVTGPPHGGSSPPDRR